jgi:hypothetical protein
MPTQIFLLKYKKIYYIYFFKKKTLFLLFKINHKVMT